MASTLTSSPSKNNELRPLYSPPASPLFPPQNALSYRVVKAKLEADEAEVQSTMEFMESHPIIRSVSEYSEFVHESIQGK